MRFQIVEPCQDVQEGEEKFGTEVKKLPTNTAESEGRELWPCAVTVQLRWDPASSRDTSVPLVRNFAKDYVCRPRVGGTETCSGGHKVTTVLGDIYPGMTVCCEVNFPENSTSTTFLQFRFQ